MLNNNWGIGKVLSYERGEVNENNSCNRIAYVANDFFKKFDFKNYNDVICLNFINKPGIKDNFYLFYAKKLNKIQIKPLIYDWKKKGVFNNLIQETLIALPHSFVKKNELFGELAHIRTDYYLTNEVRTRINNRVSNL